MNLVFITGVSRGLGLELSKAFKSENTKVVGFSRSRGEFDGAFHTCDFTKPQVADSIFESAFDSEDLRSAESVTFIFNAGILGPIDRIDRLEVYDIQENLTGNLVGSAIAVSKFLNYTQALSIPKLFIQITSGAALPERAKPAWSLYCASKAGQEQLIRSVAIEQENAERPAKLININPGVMETAMQELIRSTPKSTFPEVDRFIEMKEKGQVASPAEVAKGIAQFIEHFNELENGQRYDYDHFASSK